MTASQEPRPPLDLEAIQGHLNARRERADAAMAQGVPLSPSVAYTAMADADYLLAQLGQAQGERREEETR